MLSTQSKHGKKFYWKLLLNNKIFLAFLGRNSLKLPAHRFRLNLQYFPYIFWNKKNIFNGFPFFWNLCYFLFWKMETYSIQGMRAEKSFKEISLTTTMNQKKNRKKRNKRFLANNWYKFINTLFCTFPHFSHFFAISALSELSSQWQCLLPDFYTIK